MIVSIALIFTDYYILDPILSISIATYIVYNAIANLRKTTTLFLQAVPEDIDIQKPEKSILSLAKVDSIHHTHVWSLDGEHHVLTTHVVVIDETTRENIKSIKNAIQTIGRKLNLEHITVEIEYVNEHCYLRN